MFFFTSDLEYALLDESNIGKAALILKTVATNGVDYTTGYSRDMLRRQIGSKGIPINGIDKPLFKRPFIHESLSKTIELESAHADINRLLNAIENL